MITLKYREASFWAAGTINEDGHRDLVPHYLYGTDKHVFW